MIEGFIVIEFLDFYVVICIAYSKQTAQLSQAKASLHAWYHTSFPNRDRMSAPSGNWAYYTVLSP